jgi:integrase
MGAVNFYLKKAEETTGKSLIFLQYKYNGKRLVFSTGQRIDPANWSHSKQRIKSNKATTEDGQYALNDLLDNLERECLKSYNKHIKNGIPSTETIKGDLFMFMNQNEKGTEGPTFFNLIDRFSAGEIKHKGKDKTKGTRNIYKQTLKHLKEFAVAEKYKVDFNTINLDFYYKFVSHLKKEGLNQNSIGKHIKDIKTFMGEAIDLKYTTNYEFKNKKFVAMKEEVDSVYLTENEIMKIYRYDFSDNKRLEQVRDLFCFGCWVGLRFSDYSNVKAENKVQIDGEWFLKIKTQKTGDVVIIPCNPHVLEIFLKYDHNANKLPNAISNQKFNDYIKDACKEVSLTETGRLSTDPTKELWNCVSSHTARRSFATNYYLEGFPTLDLMKVTGHKTEAAFMKYIKTSKLDTAKRMAEHIKKNWSAKLLRVAS